MFQAGNQRRLNTGLAVSTRSKNCFVPLQIPAIDHPLIPISEHSLGEEQEDENKDKGDEESKTGEDKDEDEDEDDGQISV